MLFPLFFLVVALYFLAALPLSRRLFPGSRRKAWSATIAGALLIFAGDHLLGLAYGYVWVRAVPDAPPLPIISERIALELDLPRVRQLADNFSAGEVEILGAYAIQMVDAEYWLSRGGRSGGLQASYATLEAVIPTGRSPKLLELKAATDERNPSCMTFLRFPPPDQQRWRALAAQTLENGQSARCLAIRPITSLRAEYLLRFSSRAGNLIERFMGIGEVSTSSISEQGTGQILVEYRSLAFWGGWVQRTFWTSFATGMTAVTSLSTPGPQPSLRPISRQKVS